MKKSIIRVLNLVLTVAILLGCFSLGTVTVSALDTENTAADNSAAVSVEDGVLSIGNAFIQRNFSLAGDKVATTSIVNGRSGITLTPDAGSEDFIICVTNQFAV